VAAMRYNRSGSAIGTILPWVLPRVLCHISLSSPYDFDLYRTYGVPSDAIVYGGFTVLYRLRYYKRCKGKNVIPLTLF